MAYQKGDTVILRKYPHGGIIGWSDMREQLVGKVIVLEKMNTSICPSWLINYGGMNWAWPESGMLLVSLADDEPTMPGVKPIPASAEKPEWLVSRSATLHDNECFCGHSIPCDYHTVPATQRSPSFGEGFAMAQAIRAQFPKP